MADHLKHSGVLEAIAIPSIISFSFILLLAPPLALFIYPNSNNILIPSRAATHWTYRFFTALCFLLTYHSLNSMINHYNHFHICPLDFFDTFSLHLTHKLSIYACTCILAAELDKGKFVIILTGLTSNSSAWTSNVPLMLPSSFTIYSYSIQSPVLLNNCFTLFDLLKLPTSPPLAFHFIEKKWEQLGENVYYHYLPTDHLYFHSLPEFKFVSIDGLALFLCKANHFLFIFAYSRISSKQFSHLSPISWNSLFLLDHFHQHPHKAIFMSSKKMSPWFYFPC